jgi:hypothetical protein
MARARRNWPGPYGHARQTSEITRCAAWRRTCSTRWRHRSSSMETTGVGGLRSGAPCGVASVGQRSPETARGAPLPFSKEKEGGRKREKRKREKKGIARIGGGSDEIASARSCWTRTRAAMRTRWMRTARWDANGRWLRTACERARRTPRALRPSAFLVSASSRRGPDTVAIRKTRCYESRRCDDSFSSCPCSRFRVEASLLPKRPPLPRRLSPRTLRPRSERRRRRDLCRRFRIRAACGCRIRWPVTRRS